MGDVVAGVPGVEGDGFGEGLAAVDGVNVAALPLVFAEGAEEGGPAGVEAVEDVEGGLDGGGAGVGEVGPEFLVVGDDGGPVLGDGEAHADVRVDVTVGEVMDELADGPAAIAVGGIELGIGKAGDGGAEILGKGGEDGDGGGVVGEIDFGAAEFADGEAGIDFCGGCRDGGYGRHTRKVHRGNGGHKPGGWDCREGVGSDSGFRGRRGGTSERRLRQERLMFWR